MDVLPTILQEVSDAVDFILNMQIQYNQNNKRKEKLKTSFHDYLHVYTMFMLEKEQDEVQTYWCKQVHQKKRVYTNSHVGRQLKKVDTHVDIHLLLVVDVQLFIWIDRD